jgi:hypothetical protein
MVIHDSGHEVEIRKLMRKLRVFNPVPSHFGGGARKAVFFPGEGEMQQSMGRADFDALTGHASLLGQPLGHAITELNGGTLHARQLSGVNAALANVLDTRGRVLITQCGSWGDTGTSDSHWTLNLGEDSIERLITTPHGISSAIESRYNWLGSSRPNIVKMAFMSQMTGLDNTQLLPPYFTAFRGEDLLFGAMVEYMHHDGAAVEYAWSVPHLPIDQRQPHSLRDPIAARGGISLFARWLTERVDYDDASAPEQQLKRIAHEARRFSQRSTENLLYDYRAELARGHADQLRILKSQLAKAQSLPSDSWKGYLERGIDEVQRALAALHGPSELVKDGAADNDALLNKFRDMAAGFASALEAWPVVREASVPIASEMIGSGALKP